MFKWYQGSEICYAYLSDVQGTLDNRADEFRFMHSKWFTRGWTLQELLAPDEMVFYNSYWMKVGSKESLQKLLESVTGISHLFNFEEASIT